MGHGTEHDANAVYAALDYRFKDMGRDRFYMATVEGYPALEQALRQMKANQRLQKVYLVPFMIVAGDHAKHDMAGPKPDSWKRMVADAGYEPCCLLRGLGELPEVRQLLAEHAGQAEARQSAPFRGKLTGVGVGPGDPELLTYKAMKHIQNCDLLVLPDSDRGNCVAYQIVEKAWAGVRNKPVLQVAMPMTHDKARMAESHLAAARAVERHLDQGKQVVFLTLGDPSVYSTYFYLHRQITADGYEAEMVPGVPSFCAAAAQLGRSLGMGTEMIHIIPSWHGVEQGLDLPGVKVLMKAGSQMGRVKQALLDRGMEAAMVENCGMDGQRCFRSTAEIPEDAGYFPCCLSGRKEARDDTFCGSGFRRGGSDYGPGQRLLSQADLIVYAGSLVNPALLEYARPDCRILDSARMTLEEVVAAMLEAERDGKTTVRLHTGTPVFTGPFGSKWTGWMQPGSLMMCAPVSAPFAARRRRFIWSTRCPG